MFFYNNFNIKVLFLISIIIVLQIPLNSIIDLAFITISILIILFCKIKENRDKNFILLSIVVISLIFSIFFGSKNIDEAHSVFFSKKDIETISKILPNKIIDEIKKDYGSKFDLERALRSWDANFFSSEEKFNNHDFI